MARPRGSLLYTDECAAVVLVYSDNPLHGTHVVGSFEVVTVDGGGPALPFPTGPADLTPLAVVQNASAGAARRTIPDGYLEIDVQVPHLSYKIVDDIVLTDGGGREIIRAPAPEHHQTRFVMDGDTLTNRLRIELQPEHFPASSDSADWADVRYIGLTRGGDPGLELVAPSQRDQIAWRLDSIRLRRGCKECGMSPLGFDHLNVLVPMLSGSYSGRVAAPASTGVVPLVTRTTIVDDVSLDLRAAVDPGCNCLYHHGGSIHFDIFLRSADFPITSIELVHASSGRTALRVPVDATASGTQVHVGSWRSVSVPVAGGSTVWDAEDGVPPWHDLQLLVRRGGVAAPVPALSVVPSVRRIAFVAAPEVSEVFQTIVLSSEATFVPIPPPEDDVADDAPEPPPEGTLQIEASAEAHFPVVSAGTNWFDLRTPLGDCVQQWPTACAEAGVRVQFDMRVVDPPAAGAQLRSVVLYDRVGLEALVSVPQYAQIVASEAADDAFHFIEFDVDPSGPASPGSFDWSAVVGVGVRATPSGTGEEADQWALQISDLRFGLPQRVGHVWDPLDNYDDLGCNFGWGQYSLYRRNGPARYSHCFECCCYFDSPATLEKHCYDQGDVIGEVTPSEEGGPNEGCQVCNRKRNPQIISPRATLYEDINTVVECDDWEPCSYQDQCTLDGTCEAVEYFSCLISDFWGGDPSKNCEECDGTGPFSPTLGCQARSGHYVYEPGTSERACACLIDGVIWPHLAVDPRRPCMQCDVTISNTEWTQRNDDIICDVTQQLDWAHVPAQACSEAHICGDGVCSGERYSCAALQECEAVLPELPAVCDLTGPASETGGCQRRTLPAGTSCGSIINGCTPQPECNGALGSCPPLQYNPGIIYDDDGKSVDLFLPSGRAAHADLPALPDGTRVDAELVNFRVQCDSLRLRAAVIPEGDCLTPRVSEDVGDGFGEGAYPVLRASLPVRQAVTPLAMASDATTLVLADTGAAMLDVERHSFESHTTSSCDCLLDSRIEMSVLGAERAGVLSGAVSGLRLSGGALYDSSGTSFNFSFAEDAIDATVSTPAPERIGLWTPLSAPIDVVQQRTVGFDWSSVAGISLLATTRSLAINVTAAAIAPEVEIFHVANIRIVVGSPQKCATVGVVDANGLELAWGPESGPQHASADLDAPVDLSPLWSERTVTFDGVSLHLEVRTNAARIGFIEITGNPTSHSLGLAVPLPFESSGLVGSASGSGDWTPIHVRIRDSMIPVQNSQATWSALSHVRLHLSAAADAPAARILGKLAVRNVYFVKDSMYCSSGLRSPDWLSQDILAAKLLDDSSTAVGDSFVDGFRMESRQFSRALSYGLLEAEDIILHELGVRGLGDLFNASCSCFTDAYLEIVASFEVSVCAIARVELLDQNGDGLAVDIDVQLSDLREGLGERNVLRVVLSSDHVVGEPTSWDDVGVARFYRTGDIPAASAHLGSIVVHSLRIASTTVPCHEPEAGGEMAETPQRAPDVLHVEPDERELTWVPGRRELVTPSAPWRETESWPSAIRQTSVDLTSGSVAAWHGAAVAADSGVLVSVGAFGAPGASNAALRQTECFAEGGCGVVVGRDLVSLRPIWSITITAVDAPSATSEVMAGAAVRTAGPRTSVGIAGHVDTGAGAADVLAFSSGGELIAGGGGGLDAIVVSVDVENGDIEWLLNIGSSGDDVVSAVAAVPPRRQNESFPAFVVVGSTSATGRKAAVPPLTGEDHASASKEAGLVVAVDALGAELWSTLLGSPDLTTTVALVDIVASDDSGVVVAVGLARNGPVHFRPGGAVSHVDPGDSSPQDGMWWSFVVAFDVASGGVIWSSSVSATTSSVRLASVSMSNGVVVACGGADAVDGGVDIIVAGRIMGTTSVGADALTLAINASTGEPIWLATVGGGLTSEGREARCHCSSVSVTGDVVSTGVQAEGAVTLSVFDGTSSTVSTSLDEQVIAKPQGLLYTWALQTGDALHVDLMSSADGQVLPLATAVVESTGETIVAGTLTGELKVGWPAETRAAAKIDGELASAAFIAVSNRSVAPVSPSVLLAVRDHGGAHDGIAEESAEYALPGLAVSGGIAVVCGTVTGAGLSIAGSEVEADGEFEVGVIASYELVSGKGYGSLTLTGIGEYDTNFTHGPTRINDVAAVPAAGGPTFVFGAEAAVDTRGASLRNIRMPTSNNHSTEALVFALRHDGHEFSLLWSAIDTGTDGVDTVVAVSAAIGAVAAVGTSTGAQVIVSDAGSAIVAAEPDATIGVVKVLDAVDGHLLLAGRLGGERGTTCIPQAVALSEYGDAVYIGARFRGGDVSVPLVLTDIFAGSRTVSYVESSPDASMTTWASFVVAYDARSGSLLWLTVLGSGDATAGDTVISELVAHGSLLLVGSDTAASRFKVVSDAGSADGDAETDERSVTALVTALTPVDGAPVWTTVLGGDPGSENDATTRLAGVASAGSSIAVLLTSSASLSTSLGGLVHNALPGEDVNDQVFFALLESREGTVEHASLLTASPSSQQLRAASGVEDSFVLQPAYGITDVPGTGSIVTSGLIVGDVYARDVDSSDHRLVSRATRHVSDAELDRHLAVMVHDLHKQHDSVEQGPLTESTRGQYVRTFDGVGQAFGRGVSVGNRHVLSCGWFRGTAAFDADVQLESVGGGNEVADVSDAFIVLHSRTSADAVVASRVSATGDAAHDDKLHAATSLPDGSVHFVVGAFDSGVTSSTVVTFAGTEFGSISGVDTVVAAIDDESGSVAWVDSIGSSIGDDILRGVAASEDYVVAVGSATGAVPEHGTPPTPVLSGSIGAQIATIFSFDLNGMHNWGTAFSTTEGDGRAEASSVATSADGSIIVVGGWFSGTLQVGMETLQHGCGSFDPDSQCFAAFVVALDAASGAPLWATSSVNSGVAAQVRSAIRAVSITGSHVIAAGDFNADEVEFFSESAAQRSTPAGQSSGLLASFDLQSGEFEWIYSPNSSESCVATSVAGSAADPDVGHAVWVIAGTANFPETPGAPGGFRVGALSGVQSRTVLTEFTAESGRIEHIDILDGVSSGPIVGSVAATSNDGLNLHIAGWRHASVRFSASSQAHRLSSPVAHRLENATFNGGTDLRLLDVHAFMAAYDRISRRTPPHAMIKDRAVEVGSAEDNEVISTVLAAAGSHTALVATSFEGGKVVVRGLHVLTNDEMWSEPWCDPANNEGCRIAAIAASASQRDICVVGTTGPSGVVLGVEVSASYYGSSAVVACFDDALSTPTPRFLSAVYSFAGVSPRGIALADRTGTEAPEVWVVGSTTGSITIVTATGSSTVQNPGGGSVPMCFLAKLEGRNGVVQLASFFGSTDVGSICEASSVAAHAAPNQDGATDLTIVGSYVGSAVPLAGGSSLPAPVDQTASAGFIVRYNIAAEEFTFSASVDHNASRGCVGCTGPALTSVDSLEGGIVVAAGNFDGSVLRVNDKELVAPMKDSADSAVDSYPHSSCVIVAFDGDDLLWMRAFSEDVSYGSSAGPACKPAVAVLPHAVYAALSGSSSGFRMAGGHFSMPVMTQPVLGTNDTVFGVVAKLDPASGIPRAWLPVGEPDAEVMMHAIVPVGPDGSAGLLAAGSYVSHRARIVQNNRNQPPWVYAYTHRSQVGVFVQTLDAAVVPPSPRHGIGTLLHDGRLAGTLDTAVLRFDLWLDSTDYAVSGGRWTVANSADSPGLEFALDITQQRYGGRWLTLEAAITLLPGTTEDDLSNLRYFVLTRDSHDDLAYGERAVASWRVRRIQLVGSSASFCRTCGVLELVSMSRMVELDGDSWVPTASSTPPPDALVEPDSLLHFPVDVSSLLDRASNSLAEVTLSYTVCGTDAISSSDAASYIGGIDLLDSSGLQGVLIDFGNSDVTTEAVDSCVETSVQISTDHHIGLRDTQWNSITGFRLLASETAAGLPEDSSFSVEGVQLRAGCGYTSQLLHPQPVDSGTTMALTRDSLNLVHGVRYRLLVVETNVWGDDSPPICSAEFVVDETAPDVSNVAIGTVFDMDTAEGASATDIDYTADSRLKIGWEAMTILEPESSPTNLLVFSLADVTRDDPAGSSVDGLDAESSRRELPRDGDGWVLSNELVLEDGVQYFAHLAVANPANLFSTIVTDGVVYDASPPESGGIRDVLSASEATNDIDHQLSTTTIHAAWEAWSEPHTFVSEVRVGLGTTQEGADVIEFEVIDTDVFAHEFSATDAVGGVFVDGQIYYVLLRVANAAGATAIHSSDGLYIDTTPPYGMYTLDVWFRDAQGLETYMTEDSAAGDVALHDGESVVRGKWKCDDDESVADGARGVMTYRWRVCSTAACDDTIYFQTSSETDANGWMDVGAVPYGTSVDVLPGVDEGENLFIEVECTNPVGLSFTQVSDGMVVSRAAPDTTNAVIVDLDASEEGTVDDVDYVDELVLHSVWSGFQPAVGAATGGNIAYYEVSVRTVFDGDNDVQDWTWVGLETEALTNVTTTSLSDGVTYYVAVRAVSDAGGASEMVSDGVTVDTSPPVDGIVLDLRPYSDTTQLCPGLECLLVGEEGDDIDAQPTRTALAVRVDGAADPHSPIVSIQFAFSTCDVPLDFNTAPLTEFGSDSTQALFEDVDLLQGRRYCGSAVVTNAAGVEAVFVSDGVVFDLTPPVPLYVHGVLSVSQDDLSPTLAEEHSCVDAEAPAMAYEVRVEGPGGESVLEYVSVGSDESEVLDGLALEHATEYVVVVRCVSEAGLFAVQHSEPLVMDATGPAVDEAIIWHSSHRVVVSYQVAQDTLLASWAGFRDSESGVVSFSWAVGSSVGATDVVPLTNVGAATFAHASGLGLQDGDTVFVSVHAKNTVGLSSELASTGLTVDASVPEEGSVVVVNLAGTGEDMALTYLPTATRVDAEWAGQSDPHTNVTFEWAIGSNAFGQQVAAFVDVGRARNASMTSLQLAVSGVYFVTVRARNDAGLVSHAASAPFLVDPFPPESGIVFDGASPSTAVHFVSELDQLWCSWQGFVDEQSGIETYGIALGSNPGLADIAGFVSLGPQRVSYRFDLGADLVPGERVHCVLRATDRAGHSTVRSSSGVVPDVSDPIVGALFDGLPSGALAIPGSDVDFQANSTAIGLAWSGWSDDESGIVEQRWAVGTAPGLDDVAGWEYVGAHRQSAVRTGLELSRDETYYSTLRVVNALGMSAEASTDGVTILTPVDSVGVGDVIRPRVTFGYVPALAQADHASCECRIAGADFDKDSGICSCRPGTFLDSRLGQCVPCPADTCKPVYGNAAALCEATDNLADCGSEDLAADSPEWEPCGPEPVNPDAVRGVLAGDPAECMCPPAYYRLSGECVRCSGTQVKSDPGDAAWMCGECWHEHGRDAVLDIDWNIPSVAAETQSYIVVSVGLGTGASRWTRRLDSTATHAQFDASALPFQHGTQFHVAVRVFEESTGAVIAEDRGVSQIIDLTPPAVGTVVDGIGFLDVDVWGDSSSVSASWHSFVPDVEPFVSYYVAFGEAGHERDSLSGSFINVGNDTEATLSGLDLSEGTHVVATVRARSAISGAAVDASSDGVVVQTSLGDGNVRVRGDIQAGALDATPFPHRHAPTQRHPDRVFVTWQFAVSGLAYSLTIHDADDDSLLYDFGNVGGVTTWVAEGLSLPPGVSFYARVVARNVAGVTALADSLPTLVDPTPPNIGVVETEAVPGSDLAVRGPSGQVYQTSSTEISVSWEFEEEDSSIEHYTVSIGGVVGGTIIVEQDSVPAPSAGAHFDELALRHGHCYLVHVSATNTIGDSTPDVLAPPVCIDKSDPIARVGFTDSAAPRAVEAVLEDIPELTELVALETVAVAASARNAAANSHATIFRSALMGTEIQLDFVAQDVESGLAEVQVRLSSSQDPEDNEEVVSEWESVELSDVSLSSTSQVLVEGADSSDLPLGTAVFAHLRVINGAGSATASSSSAALVTDSSGPSEVASVAISGSGVVQTGSPVVVTWEAEDDESGVAVQWIRVVGLLDWRKVAPDARAAEIHGLALAHGMSYDIDVVACNPLALCTSLSGATLAVDDSAPRAGTVYLGAKDNDLEQSLCAALGSCSVPVPVPASLGEELVSWGGFDDAESDISGYRFAVGTTAYGSQLAGPIDTGLDTTVDLADLLTSEAVAIAPGGAPVYFTVTARNSVGLSTSVSAALAIPDDMPPVPTLLWFVAQRASSGLYGTHGSAIAAGGNSTPFVAPSSASMVDVAWDPVVDHGVGVAAVSVQLRNSGGDVVAEVTEATETSVSFGVASLPARQPLWAEVVATDAADNTVSFTSAIPLIVDDTPPVAGGVVMEGTVTGLSAELDCLQRNGVALAPIVPLISYFDETDVDVAQLVASARVPGAELDSIDTSNVTTLAASWLPFTDPESGIRRVEVALGTEPGLADVVPFSAVPAAANHAQLVAPQQPEGAVLHVGVRATNAAGLTAEAVWGDGVRLLCGSGDPACVFDGVFLCTASA